MCKHSLWLIVDSRTSLPTRFSHFLTHSGFGDCSTNCSRGDGFRLITVFDYERAGRGCDFKFNSPE